MSVRSRQRATEDSARAARGVGRGRAKRQPATGGLPDDGSRIGALPKRGFSPVLMSAGVALVAMAAYWPILRNGFTYDDVPAVSDNSLLPLLTHPATYFSRTYFEASGEATYRPLVSLSYGLEYALWGRSALGSHVTNLVLHALLSVLLVPVCLAMGAHRRVAWTAALLYAVHPLCSEAVCSIGFREDLLCAIFFLAAVALWPPLAKSLAKASPPCAAGVSREAGASRDSGASRGAGVSREAGASCGAGVSPAMPMGSVPLAVGGAVALLYALALLSKEMALSLPLILLGLDLRGAAWRSPEWRVAARRRLRWHLGLWLMTGAALALVLTFTGENAGFAHAAPIAVWKRLASFGSIVARYLALFVWPHPLCVDRQVALDDAAVWGAGLACWVGLAGLGFWAWRGRMAFLPAWQALIAFLILLGPVSNLIPLAHPMAERYLTLPLAALCYLAAEALGRAPWREARAAVLVVTLVAGGILSWQRSLEWRTDATLWWAEVGRNPLSARANGGVGTELIRQEKFEPAIAYLKRAAELAPQEPRHAANLGGAYMQVGRTAEARTELQRAIALDTQYALSHSLLAELLATEGHRDEALAECREALRWGQGQIGLHANVGAAYCQLGEFDRAVEEFRAVLAANPNSVHDLLNLDLALESKRDQPGAIAVLQRVLQLDPANAEAKGRLRELTAGATK